MIVSGLPALPHRQSLREQAALRRLPDLVAQVRKLQEELDALKREVTRLSLQGRKRCFVYVAGFRPP